MAPKSRLIDAYLVLYNLANCATWSRVLLIALPSIFACRSPADLLAALAALYALPGLASALWWAQFPAVLEVHHAGLGLVRSPLVVTFLQVLSRIAVLIAIRNSPESQVQWGAGVMILSWTLAEIPRYAFYVAALLSGDAARKTPYLLFWLRYSVFAVLYPTGISGEISVLLKALADDAFLGFLGPAYHSYVYYFTLLSIGSYVPFSVPMVSNMWANRGKAFKKRFAKPPPPVRGLVFPLDKKGKRSSTLPAKKVMSCAVAAADDGLAKAIEKEKNWRFGYVKHFLGLVKAQCASKEVALKIARQGLKTARDTFEFVSSDGTSASLEEAMSSKSKEDAFHTGLVQGVGKVEMGDGMSVPYKGKTLSGEELKEQAKKWVEYGTIEPSAGEAIMKVVDNPNWLKEIKQCYFVLLGAGSAMGPFEVLMSLGANVIAIDLDRPGIWSRLLSRADKSSGSITFPIKKKLPANASREEVCANAGCNLFTHTPLIRDWLLQLHPGKTFVVGSYAYLNGPLHVQVSLAMDAITKDLTEKRMPKPILAYLCTPTDIHLIPPEAHRASSREYAAYRHYLFCNILTLYGVGKFLRINAKKPIRADGGPFHYVNGLSVAQGPNYALAKRLQHWRAVVAREDQKCVVSSNVAPSTSTLSVIQNKTFAWAYEGMPYFRPFEIFAPETSNAVMTALLFYDMKDPKSAANPQNDLSNPNMLFADTSFNGGAWRCAYELDSIGEASVLVYFLRLAWPHLKVGGGIFLAYFAGKYLEYF